MATVTIKVKGIDKVLQNLNAEIGGIKRRTRRGLIKAGAVIKTQSVNLAPIDIGNLRASHYLYWSGGAVDVPQYQRGGDGGSTADIAKLTAAHGQEMAQAASDVNHQLIVRVGASAHYALFVHEGTKNMAARKFLQNAISQNLQNIVAIVANEAQIT